MLDFGIDTARFLQFLAGMIAFGVPCFCLYGLDEHSPVANAMRGWLLSAGIAALAGGVLWFWLTVELFTSEDNIFALIPKLPGLAFSSSFGHIILARVAIAGLLLASAIFAHGRGRLWFCAAIGAAYAASLAWTGHAMDAEGPAGIAHLANDILHLLTAAAWLGALPPLLYLLAQAWRTPYAREVRDAHIGLSRFSSIGPGIVAMLIVSGVANAWFLIGTDVFGALRTPYGLTLAFKLAVASAMLILAANNRYRLTPDLRATLGDADARATLMALQRSVGLETALAVILIAAVALLGTLPPPTIN